MSNQNKSLDKVNMSLDDIIKLNRNQSRQNKFSANRNINGNNKPQQQQNGQRRNFNNGNNQNRRPNQQRRQQQQQQKAPVNNKPYGMLNRSKTIQKRNNFQQNKQKVIILQTNRNQQQSASRGIPRNLNNRRRLANAGAPRLFNRFGSKAAANSAKFQGQKQNFARNNQQQQHQPQRNRTFRQQPIKNVKIQMQQKRLQQLRQPRVANNVRQKIAMQSARKNVMKAKRVLANKVTAKKGPIQQIMTQRYAKSLGLIKPVGVAKLRKPMAVKRALPKQSNKLLTVNVNNRINKTNRVKQQQRKNLVKNVQQVKQQFKNKRPVLNRNRQQQGQSIPGRKVFF